MKWEKSKAFFLLLAVCFCLFSASSYAEVCYEDEDHSELMKTFDELESINKQQATQISELETELMISEQETKGALSSLDAVEKSLQEERNANLFQVIGAGGIGLIAGYIVCWVLNVIHELREYRAVDAK